MRALALVLLTGLLTTPETPLVLRVSPRVSLGPTDVYLTLIIQRDARNRSLSVTADSGDFSRSSAWTLDGEQSPRVFDVRWVALPCGDYEFVAMLGRTDTTRFVRVFTQYCSAQGGHP